MLSVQEIHTYYGKSHILQGVSLDVESGNIVALMGRNGVGKTTTMRSIMGLTPPRTGKVLLEGVNVTGAPPYHLAQMGVAYVPESRQIFPRLSVIENIRIGLDLKKLSESEKLAALDLVFGSFPRLKERQGQLGSTLSGGEQQMLAIARAVVTRPKLILLDEPTEGLMPSMVNEIERVIMWMADELNITVLLVEQDYRLSLRTSSECYIMAKGRIVHHGLSRDVSADETVLRERLGVA